MTAPNLEFRDTSDNLLTAPPSFSGVVPGTPSAAQTVRVYNNFGGSGADTARGVRLHSLSKDAGTTDFFEAGHEFVDRRYFQARITGGLGGLTVQTGGWTALGADAFLSLPDLAQGEGVTLEIRVNAPADAETAHYIPELQLRFSISEAIGGGWGDVAGGVVSPLVDANRAVLLVSAGATVENPGGVDDQVQVDDTAYTTGGKGYGEVRQLVQLDANDGDSVALAAGEAYYGLVYGGASGIAVEKGSKATTPLTDADKPALPAGGVPLTMVLREFDGLINNADLEDLREPGNFDFSSNGLTGTVGPGVSRSGAFAIVRQFASTVTLIASATNRIWGLGDGSFSVTTTAARPEPLAVLLHEATTDGSGVTDYQDRRGYVGVETFVARMRLASVAASVDGYAFFPFNRRGYIRRPFGVLAVLDEDWTGGASGAILFDVLSRSGTGSYTTLFTSSGTEDRRPSIAYNASPPLDVAAFPEVVEVDPLAQLKATIVSVPGAGSSAAGAEVLLTIEIPQGAA